MAALMKSISQQISKKPLIKEPISFYPDDNTQRIGDIKGNGDIWYEFSGTIVDIFKRKQKFKENREAFLNNIQQIVLPYLSN